MVSSRQSLPSSGSASSLSDPCRTAITSTLDRIRATDRGSVRARNRQTAVSRAEHFVHWGASKGFSDVAFEYTSPAEAGEIIAAYAQEVAEGASLKHTSQPHIKTIQGYVRAAATIAVTFGNDDPRFLPNCTDHKGRRRYIPLLEQVFATAKKWTPLKRQECLPISVAILDTLLTLARSKISNGSELRLPALVRDAAILGTFTGSRISEYAQASTPAGSPFATSGIRALIGDY